MQVLVVDDDPMVRQLMADVLDQAGYRVSEAGTAADAIVALNDDGSPDLLVTDVRMPGSMDGFGLACWLRRRSPATKILVVSGFASEGAGDRRCYDAYLSKPFTAGKLRSIADGLIGFAA